MFSVIEANQSNIKAETQRLELAGAWGGGRQMLLYWIALIAHIQLPFSKDQLFCVALLTVVWALHLNY